MDNKEIEAFVTKVMKGMITTGAGGQVNTQQLAAFIETTIDMSGFLKTISNYTDIVNQLDLDTLGIGTGIIRAGVEGINPEELIGITNSKRSLAPIELLVPVAISYEYLRRAIGTNGGAFNPDSVNAVEEAITRAIAKQFATDLVSLFFNGDKTSQDNFTKSIDGIIVKAAADNNVKKGNYTDADPLVTVFKKMLVDLPKKYRDDKASLRYYVSPDTELAYREYLAKRNTQLGDSILFKNEPVYYNGILIEPNFAMPDNRMILTKPENFAVGYGSTMSIDRDKDILARKVVIVSSCYNDFNYRLSELMVMYSKTVQG
jgi:hypothetical protein